MKNKDIYNIFERIKNELKDGSLQYYSTATDSHYLYVGDKLVFIINMNELRPNPSEIGLYVIKYERAGKVPVESFISSVPLSDLENYIYHYLINELWT